MSLLLVVWVSAVLVLVSLLLTGILRLRRGEETCSAPRHFLDLFVGEATGSLADAGVYLMRFLPHGRRAARTVIFRGARVHELFTTWIFGRMERKKGRSSSFFLKHLAEHQETLRRGTEERHGY